jgi:hypothetical protein
MVSNFTTNTLWLRWSLKSRTEASHRANLACDPGSVVALAQPSFREVGIGDIAGSHDRCVRPVGEARRVQGYAVQLQPKPGPELVIGYGSKMLRGRSGEMVGVPAPAGMD